MRALPEVTERAKKFLGEENQQNLRRSLANIEQATNSATPVVEDSRKVLANMGQQSDRLDKLSTAISSEIADSTLPKVDQAVARIDGRITLASA